MEIKKLLQKYLVVKDKFASCVVFVQKVQIVQHGWIGKHEVHNLMAKQSTQLCYDLNILKQNYFLRAKK